jgi:MinD superfamily P-loop ATPase
MQQLAILSGKGGTGKTTITAALAPLAAAKNKLIFVDADVDASNLELLLSPTKLDNHDFIGGEVAVVDPAICAGCGTCAEICRFDALIPGDTYRIDPLACEGCRSCFYQCPNQAIRMEPVLAGHWYRSSTRFGDLFHADLYAGQGASGKLVTALRQAADQWDQGYRADILMIDGPPGIGCPVIATCRGVDLALIITEPTISGMEDLKRILAVTDHFDVPALVCINKADINPHRVDEIEGFCAERGAELLPKIIYDPVVPQAMADGLPVTEYTYSKVYHEIMHLWDQVDQRLENSNQKV